uniref:Uncharacterized protein n=1 Tax=Pipistrellus kuhlii TaxID=59472 RepID=A0A7J7W3M1_PIPKU|nr:hypothetical protein mPipKuh1_008196 [Pipistrellus kuhlii]
MLLFKCNQWHLTESTRRFLEKVSGLEHQACTDKSTYILEGMNLGLKVCGLETELQEGTSLSLPWFLSQNSMCTSFLVAVCDNKPLLFKAILVSCLLFSSDMLLIDHILIYWHGWWTMDKYLLNKSNRELFSLSYLDAA